jgi:hypothetical protein
VAEATNGLEALQSIYYDLIDKGADLTDVLISAAYDGRRERADLQHHRRRHHHHPAGNHRPT